MIQTLGAEARRQGPRSPRAQSAAPAEMTHLPMPTASGGTAPELPEPGPADDDAALAAVVAEVTERKGESGETRKGEALPAVEKAQQAAARTATS